MTWIFSLPQKNTAQTFSISRHITTITGFRHFIMVVLFCMFLLQNSFNLKTDVVTCCIVHASTDSSSFALPNFFFPPQFFLSSDSSQSNTMSMIKSRQVVSQHCTKKCHGDGKKSELSLPFLAFYVNERWITSKWITHNSWIMKKVWAHRSDSRCHVVNFIIPWKSIFTVKRRKWLWQNITLLFTFYMFENSTVASASTNSIWKFDK